MKKTLKTLMLIGAIALGMNFAGVKAQAVEETTVVATTVTEETTTAPETTTKVEEPTTKQPTTEKTTTKPNVDTKGTKVKKGGYVKKSVYAYNLKLEKVTKVKKGVRYYVYKKCNSGYSMLKVGNKKLLVKSKYVVYKCNAKKIVNTLDKKYSYANMKSDLKKLKEAYGSILKVEVAGKSLDKRNLYYVTLGKETAKKTVYVETSIHAREYMNTKFMMKVIEEYCRGYDTKKYQGKNYSTIFNKVKLVIMPMVNPDGVTISQYGPKKIRDIN